MIIYRILVALIPKSIKIKIKEKLPKIIIDNKLIEDRLTYIDKQLSSLQILYSRLETKTTGADEDSPKITDISMAKFYSEFELKFRGSQFSIMERMREHVSLITAMKTEKDSLVGLDLACGRGEWITLLKERDVNVLGVDINPFFVNECRASGLEVICEDVFTFLQSNSKSDYDFISSFHFIEHLPFERIILFLKLAYSKLKPGGLFLIETPNCGNLIVGASTFNIDPTHISPLHPDYCKFLFEFIGFKDVTVIGLSANTAMLNENKKRVGEELAGLIWGSRDFACIGYKR